MEENAFVKKSFFEHLSRQGFTDAHVEAYDEYFDFLLEQMGDVKLMELEPEVIYRASMEAVGKLDGDDVIEAFLVMLEYFMAWWAERWEAMHPEEWE